MKLDLREFWKVFGLPEPVPEYRFNPKRRWRCDFAWPNLKIALEVEGGIFQIGRHNRPVGFTKDIEKYNDLALRGYRLFRFTPSQMRNGEALEVLQKAFKKGESYN